eukprot:scaffold22752_cov52-Phaeocystis_antarctica.AAC.12
MPASMAPDSAAAPSTSDKATARREREQSGEARCGEVSVRPERGAVRGRTWLASLLHGRQDVGQVGGGEVRRRGRGGRPCRPRRGAEVAEDVRDG